MKLLIDFNNLAFGSFHMDLKLMEDRSDEIKKIYGDNDGFLKHLLITKILDLKKEMKISANDVIICADHPQSWRKLAFKYYKACRKKAREESDIDFDKLYKAIDELAKAIRAFFPFHFFKEQYMEGDDWIAFMAQHYSKLGEQVTIVSTDGDFKQLLRYKGVRQYNQVKREFVKCDDPKHELMIKILRGDSGDGVPNVMSDDDAFVVEGKRQNPFGEVAISKVIASGKPMDEFLKEKGAWHRYLRNKRLIDLSMEHLPVAIVHRMNYLLENNKTKIGDPEKVMKYFDMCQLNYLKTRVAELFK